MRDTIIVIPTLNEEENIAKIIELLIKTYPDIGVLVVDDASQDKTQEIVKSLDTRYPNRVHLLARTSNPGYGNSIIDGLKWALKHKYSCAISMDADFSHDYMIVKELRELVIEKNCAVAIGSRYVPGGGIANWSHRRKLLSRLANFYVRFILDLQIHDTTSGFVGYSREALGLLLKNPPKSRGYSFLVETKYKLAKSNLHICEYPIIFTDRREGQSKMSGKVIWESIFLPWRLRLGL
ncbi:MAG TPA: polyprenol monophosphomannose synthase [Candidatus Paceibacterota bacterium]